MQILSWILQNYDRFLNRLNVCFFKFINIIHCVFEKTLNDASQLCGHNTRSVFGFEVGGQAGIPFLALIRQS